MVFLSSVKKIFSISRKKLILVVLGAVIISLAIGGLIYYQTQFKSQKVLGAEMEVKNLVEKVGALIDLPTDEDPVVATVSDAKELTNQPFFAKAVNGDKVLAYTKNKKAILYRPSTDKIIEVTFYNPPPENNSATQSASQAVSSVKIAVYNGTKIAGLAKKQADFIESNFENVEIVTATNAKEDYDSTIIVDLTGRNKNLAEQLAKEFKGQVKALPSGEEKPDAEILVILGEAGEQEL